MAFLYSVLISLHYKAIGLQWKDLHLLKYFYHWQGRQASVTFEDFITNLLYFHILVLLCFSFLTSNMDEV